MAATPRDGDRGGGAGARTGVDTGPVPVVGPVEADAPTVAQRRRVGTSGAACAACGHRNGADRLLCAACGRALHADRRGVAPPGRHHAVGRANEVVGEPRLRDRRRLLRGALVAVLVLGLAAGGGVLVGWLATRDDVRVVAPEPSPTPSPVDDAPTFPAEAFPGDPAPLRVVGVGATGGLDDEQSATALVDGDGATAWAGASPEGGTAAVGVALALEGPAWVRRIEVLNGPPPGGGGTGVRLLRVRGDAGAAVEVELLDLDGWQEVTLPAPLRTEQLRLELQQGLGPGQPVVLREVDVLGHLADQPPTGDPTGAPTADPSAATSSEQASEEPPG